MRILRSISVALVLIAVARPAAADDAINPDADFKAFRDYFTKTFPNVPLTISSTAPIRWTPSCASNGRRSTTSRRTISPSSAASRCSQRRSRTAKATAIALPNKGIGIRQNYPYFDDKTGEVITLELALNRCRETNGEAPYSYVKDEMASLTAYMAFTSRGKLFDIKIPNDPRALAAYQNGERYFYTRRGQLNFSCASCHVQNPGNHIRTEVLAPALGILAGMPIYRSEWNGMGTMSRRLVTCNSQVRGVPLDAAGRGLSRRRILSDVHGQRPAGVRAGDAAVMETNHARASRR